MGQGTGSVRPSRAELCRFSALFRSFALLCGFCRFALPPEPVLDRNMALEGHIPRYLPI